MAWVSIQSCGLTWPTVPANNSRSFFKQSVSSIYISVHVNNNFKTTYLQIVLNDVLVKKGSRHVSQTILQFNVGGYQNNSVERKKELFICKYLKYRGSLKHQALPEELRNNSSSKGIKKNNILPLSTMSNVLLNEYFQHTRKIKLRENS